MPHSINLSSHPAIATMFKARLVKYPFLLPGLAAYWHVRRISFQSVASAVSLILRRERTMSFEVRT